VSLYDLPPTCFGLYMAILREVSTKEYNNGNSTENTGITPPK
jgi:hypothetical protein